MVAVRRLPTLIICRNKIIPIESSLKALDHRGLLYEFWKNKIGKKKSYKRTYKT